jgi:hypothetical protein
VRNRIIELPAHVAAQKRAIEHGAIRRTFDSLGLSFDFDDLVDYVPCSLVESIRHTPHDVAHARLVGAIAGAIITAVEDERYVRDWGPRA